MIGMFQPEVMPLISSALSRRVAQPVHQRRIIAVTTDPQRRRVSLTLGRWDHIASRHPELRQQPHLVMRAIHAPAVQRTKSDGEAWFYLPGGPSAWIKVVVVYSGDVGLIITAFPRRAMP